MNHALRRLHKNEAVAEIKTDENGIRYVNVPNSLLTVPLDIEVYLYSSGEQCQLTVCKYVFNVIERAKPENYVYTEDEHKDFDQLLSEMENNLTEMEKNLELTKQYRDEAKATDVGTLTDDVNELKGDLADNRETLIQINKSLSEFEVGEYTVESGYYDLVSPTVRKDNSNYQCIKMAVEPNDILKITADVQASQSLAMAMCYDADFNYKSYVEGKLSERTKFTDYEFIIPNGIRFIICSYHG